jgi:hypothetical protein
MWERGVCSNKDEAVDEEIEAPTAEALSGYLRSRFARADAALEGALRKGQSRQDMNFG